jgi:undecaprenyl-diphosphatase
MSDLRAIQVLRRADAAELALCLYLNRACGRRGVREFFGAISRLGDGVAWYVLIFALPFLYPSAGPLPSVRMAMTGIAGVLIYKALKRTLVRERPFIACAGIALGTAPLDRYSFPSGHTLHAVSFTTMTVSLFPELGLLLVPFAALVGASRVVLGLHYPSDVAAGALLGFGLASLSLAVELPV